MIHHIELNNGDIFEAENPSLLVDDLMNEYCLPEEISGRWGYMSDVAQRVYRLRRVDVSVESPEGFLQKMLSLGLIVSYTIRHDEQSLLHYTSVVPTGVWRSDRAELLLLQKSEIGVVTSPTSVVAEPAGIESADFAEIESDSAQ